MLPPLGRPLNALRRWFLSPASHDGLPARVVPKTSDNEAAAARRFSTLQFSKVDCLARLAEMLQSIFPVARMTG